MKRCFSTLLVIFLCFGFTITISSCDTISSITADVLNVVGLGDDQAADKTNKTTKKSKAKKKSEKTPKEAEKSSVKEDKNTEGKIVVSKEEDQRLETKSPTQQNKVTNKTTPIDKITAPITITKKIGGAALKILADDKYIYMDFAQGFALYDHQLKKMARKTISAPVKSVRTITKNNKTYVFLREENNILEIYELIPAPKTEILPYQLVKKESFDVSGDFTWIDDKTLLIYFPDKLQFLDISDNKNIKIINELPIGDVTDIYLIDKYLYVSRNGFLDVLSLDKYDLLSSLRIGTSFTFIDLVKTNKNKKLILALINNKAELQAIQYLTLTDDLAGVKDFDKKHTLSTPLNEFEFSAHYSIIMGREVSKDEQFNPVKLFSLQHGQFLRGPLSTNTKLTTWAFHQDNLYLVDDQGASINKVVFNNKIIAKSHTVQETLKKNRKNVPLAQLGASKLVKDEYTLSASTTITIQSDARNVVLLNKDNLAIFERNPTTQLDKIVTTTNLSQDDFSLGEPQSEKKTRYQNFLTTDFGTFLYSDVTNKVSLLDIDYKTIQELPVTANKLISWVQFTQDKKDILAISEPNLKARNTNEAYVVTFYELISPTNLPVIRSLYFKETPFVFYVPQNQIIILTKKQMALYLWSVILDPSSQEEDDDENDDLDSNPIKKKKQKKVLAIKPAETVALAPDFPSIEQATIAPAFDRIYALIHDKNYKILVMNIFDTTDKTILEDFDISPSHFLGSSFSKKGRLFILPSTEGTLFYDMTQLDKVNEVAHWAIPSFSADVAMHGQFICVALGYQGVYCGHLMF
ncbi:MAG: hypothetical protein ABII18_11255 [bacterium]|nr:hypothetical protein [bacterium]MBU1918776.1 hypothetical protein [bacterium]